MAGAQIGHNSRLTREELELAFKDRTRQQRIKENTPFDLQWQWEVWLSDLSSNGKLVAFAVRIYATHTGADSRPSIDVLVQLTGLSRQTVVSQLKAIEKALLLTVERAKGRGGNSYTLVIPQRTTDEIATVIDFQNSLATRRLNDGNSQADRPLTDENSQASRPFQKSNGQTDRLLNDGNSLIDENNSLTIRPDITKDITNKKTSPGNAREAAGSAAKIASAVAAGITTTVSPVAAAPPHPAEQVYEAPAECWQTGKAQQDASLNPHEARAQRQVWITPTGTVQVAGEFKAELQDSFPLVDLHCGLSTAAANVNAHRGAIVAMQTIRREFGYMQQREQAKANRSAASGGYQSFSDREVERHRKLMDLLGD